MKAKKYPTKPKKKATAGRPSKFNAINLELMRKLYEMGHTDFEVCNLVGISQRSLYNWQVNNQEFMQSIKGWKEKAIERVEKRLFERAFGYSHESEEIFCAFGKVTRVKTVKHYPPSEIAAFFLLKNIKPDQYRETPPPALDPRFEDAELVFPGVPNQKSLAAEKQFAKYYDQN